MPTKIQLKRGQNTNIDAAQLSSGEPAFVTDTGKLYVGNGTGKVVINPMDKPSGLNTTNTYTKIKVNDYGQIVEQSNLVATDIPTIPSTQVTGLGTCATINTGVATGQIPTLDSTGKFPASTIPNVVASISYAYSYMLSNSTVGTGAYIPLSHIFGTTQNFTLNANGSITIKLAGIYLVSYNVTASNADATTALTAPSGTGYMTGTVSRSTSGYSTPFVTCSATAIRNYNVSDLVGIKNNSGSLSLNAVGLQCGLTIVKIGS